MPDYLFLVFYPIGIFGIILGISYLKISFEEKIGTLVLGILFLTVSYNYLITFFVATGIIEFIPHFLGTHIPFSFLVYPLIYLAVAGSLGENIDTKSVLIHSSAFIFSIFLLSNFWLKSAAYKIDLIQRFGRFEAWLGVENEFLIPGPLFLGLRIVQLIFYLTLLILLIKKHNFFNLNSSIKGQILGFSCFMGLHLFILGYLLIRLPNTNFDTFLIFTKLTGAVAFLFFVYFYTELGLYFSTENFNGEEVDLEEIYPEISSFDTRIKTKPLLEKDSDYIKNLPKLSLASKKRWLVIESHLKDEMPYLEQDFSIKKLEADLNISSKTIGKTIKSLYESNFNQFINQLRIEYVLYKLDNDAKWRSYTVEALANNIGFNSTNSFYAYFKEFTGQTPRAYILQHVQSKKR